MPPVTAKKFEIGWTAPSCRTSKSSGGQARHPVALGIGDDHVDARDADLDRLGDGGKPFSGSCAAGFGGRLGALAGGFGAGGGSCAARPKGASPSAIASTADLFKWFLLTAQSAMRVDNIPRPREVLPLGGPSPERVLGRAAAKHGARASGPERRKNNVALSKGIQQNSHSRERPEDKPGGDNEMQGAMQSMRRERRRAAMAAVLLLAVLRPDGLQQDQIQAGDQEGQRVPQGRAVPDRARRVRGTPSRLDPSETKLNKHIGIAYMGMYQPGSKHPKDLEFAPEGDRQPEDLRRGSTPRTEGARVPRLDVPEHRPVRRRDRLLPERDARSGTRRTARRCSRSAMLYFKKGDFDNGVEVAEEAARVEGNNPEVYVPDRRPGLGPVVQLPRPRPGPRGARSSRRASRTLNKALEIKPDYFEALSYINLLYREKAKMETDPAKKQEYTDTANKYLAQALEMRKAAQEKRRPRRPRRRRNRASSSGVSPGRGDDSCLRTH